MAHFVKHKKNRVTRICTVFTVLKITKKFIFCKYFAKMT